MPFTKRFVLTSAACAMLCFVSAAAAKADSMIVGHSTGAQATAMLTNVSLVGAAANNKTFTFTLTNTSPFDARVTGLGFDLIAADFSGNNSSGLNGFSGTAGNTNFTFRDGSLGNVPQFNDAVLDFGFTTHNNGKGAAANNDKFAGGSPNKGLAPQQSLTFSATGNFQNLTAAQITSSLYVRFQRVGANGEGSDVGRPLPPTTPVPEPASLLLLGTGLAGAIGAVRRKRQANGGEGA